MDGRDAAPLGLAGIKIRRGQHNHVPDPPLSGIQNFDRVAAGLRRAGQLGPGVRPVAVQVQRSARDHDPAIPHAHQLLILDVVGEGDGRLVRVGLRLGADFQLPVQHDPLGGQFQVGLVREAEFAVDRHTVQRRRTDIQEHFLVSWNIDQLPGNRHLVMRPGGWIRPAPSLSPAAAPHRRQRMRRRKGTPESATQEATSDSSYYS